MNSIKLTPFILFLLLLIILVISSLFGKKLIVEEEEFSTDYQEGMTTTSLNNISLLSYSTTNKVWNLYDSIYFDEINGNVIELNPINNTDTNGNTSVSTSTVVTKRSNYMTTYYVLSAEFAQTVQDSQINNITPKYTSCIYPSQMNNYNVFYMPWNKDTFIHIIDNTAKTQLATFLFSPGSETKSIYYSPPTDIGLTNFVTDNNSDNNKMVIEPLYDGIKKVYQLSQYVKYDIINSNIIITTEQAKTIAVYDINKNMFINTPNDVNNDISKKSRPKPNLISYTVLDNLGQNLVLCIPNNNSVLIALISYSDSNKTSYVLKGVYRFNEFGLDDGNQTPNNVIADYYKLFWNSPDVKKTPDVKTTPDINNQDYILKTQIVPPTCPTCPTCPNCPTCPSNGICTNCGGTGGSGTLSKSGNTIVSGNSTGTNKNYSKIGSGTFETNANPDTVGGSLTLTTYDTVAGIQDVAKTGAGVVTGVAGTLGGVANNLISTTGSILKPNQTGGLQNNGQNVLNQRSTPGYTQPGVGTNNQYSDPYSYYGQLPPKGKTNYVPVTADFSRFGR
jgi:hypothetical protein